MTAVKAAAVRSLMTVISLEGGARRLEWVWRGRRSGRGIPLCGWVEGPGSLDPVMRVLVPSGVVQSQLLLAQTNQTIPLKAATATARYRPIIVWDPLARMAAIMVMVATATAVTRMLVDRAARLSRQLRKADRLTLRAKISRAAFSRFVMSPMATPWRLGRTAATIERDAAVARHNAIVARTFAHRDTRESSPWMTLGISAALAAENATAPAIDNQNKTKSNGLVIVNGTDAS